MELPPLFIVGVPRSGTTLLRVMLDSHPRLAVGPECPWIGGGYGHRPSVKDLYEALTRGANGPVGNFSGIGEEDVARALGDAVAFLLQRYAERRGKARWVEKTPNQITEIPLLHRLFPDARYLHVVRDGRDVACSSFVERRSWGPDLVNGGERIANTRLHALERWHRWVDQFERWREDYRLPVHTVRYEDLVHAPRGELQRILDFFGEPWSDEVLRYAGHPHDLPEWEAGSRDVARRPGIDATSVGRWRAEFTAEEKSEALFAAATLARFGYPP